MASHGARVLIDDARSSLSAGPRITLETNSLHLQKKLVLAGQGWTVLPASCVCDDVAGGVLSGAPLADPDMERALVLGLQRTGRITAAVDAVAKIVVSLSHDLVTSGAWPSARIDLG